MKLIEFKYGKNLTGRKEEVIRDAEAYCKALDTLAELHFSEPGMELLFPTFVKRDPGKESPHGKESCHHLTDDEQFNMKKFMVSEPGKYIDMTEWFPDHEIVILGNFYQKPLGSISTQSGYYGKSENFPFSYCASPYDSYNPIGFRTRTSKVSYLIKAGADTYFAVTENSTYLLRGPILKEFYNSYDYNIRETEIGSIEIVD